MDSADIYRCHSFGEMAHTYSILGSIAPLSEICSRLDFHRRSCLVSALSGYPLCHSGTPSALRYYRGCCAACICTGSHHSIRANTFYRFHRDECGRWLQIHTGLVVYEAPFPEGVFAVFFAVLSTAVTFAVFPARSIAVAITLTFARVRHAQIRKRLMRISWAFRGTSYPNI